MDSIFFFFKQKTAYEMRISDWSSDVCSSDLLRRRERSDEAGIKYLIMAAFSSAFLLFGMALVYATTGAMELGEIARYLSDAGELSLILMTGFGLIVVGVGFKLSIVPFPMRSDEQTSELQSLMRISYHVFCLKNKTNT